MLILEEGKCQSKTPGVHPMPKGPAKRENIPHSIRRLRIALERLPIKLLVPAIQ